MRNIILTLLFAALLLPMPAHAKTWTTDYAKSRISFSGKQNDQSFNGLFRKYQVTINFDPEHPEKGKISAIIDIGSVTTGNSELDGYLPQNDWFNTKLFPRAEFASTMIDAASAPSCYEAVGTLTIKGMSKQVTLPFCLKPEGDRMRAQGKLVLMRNEFNIGTGQFADDGIVEHAVTVTVDIAAKAG